MTILKINRILHFTPAYTIKQFKLLVSKVYRILFVSYYTIGPIKNKMSQILILPRVTLRKVYVVRAYESCNHTIAEKGEQVM